MNELGSLLAYLRDPRLSAHAASAKPAWLWSVDATRVLWANPAAAAIFEADSPAALAGFEIDPKGSAALQIARIAGTLPLGATPRLERLRGFGGRLGRALMCACSRVTLEDRTPAVLVAAVETAGEAMPLPERVRRLCIGIEQPAAFFAADGNLIHATPAGTTQLRGLTSLAALGLTALADQALISGRARGSSHLGTVSIDRIGGDGSTALVVSFPQAASQPSEQPAREAAPVAKQPDPPPAPIVEAVAPPVSAPPVQPAAPVQPVKPAAERRQQNTMRFVWQMDADGRITIDSGEFAALIGEKAITALKRPWAQVAAELDLDPEGQIARAIATRDTWSGITVSFPIDDTKLGLPVELSGLPSFDRERNYLGYRGFGICRSIPQVTRPQPVAPPKPEPLETKPDVKAEPKVEVRPEPPAIREERPALTVVPPVENVLPFRASAPAEKEKEKSPNLTPVERKAFRELASKLTARLREAQNGMASSDMPDLPQVEEADDEPLFEPERPARPAEPAPPAAERAASGDQRPILDRLPIGVLVYRLDRLLYANRAFLDWTGYESIYTLADAGGLDALFIEPGSDPIGDVGTKNDPKNATKSLAITTSHGSQMPIEARLFSTPWDGESALVLMLAGSAAEKSPAAEDKKALGAAEAEVQELRSVLDTATDGIVMLDREGRIVSTNRSAETLFGYQSRELTGRPLAGLFTPESQRTAFDALDRINRGASEEDREVLGRGREGVPVPLVMSIGKVAGNADRLVAVFRDIGSWKKAEQDLIGAKRQAETASSAKSDFLAKISHEIRTPLNAIIGFSEVMIEERFGTIGNERYKQYLKDIHASGEHLISLLNDLLDLSKIEAGKLDLNFVKLDLNELTQQCVALMQPQANRERVIIRTALSSALPPVLADARSVRQIALNLLSNSIKFTGAGGQVIVSTALADTGDVVLRIRDTGVGMSEKDVAIALEPFRQLATSPRAGSGGTGLGLPLTKALAEANRATFNIKSAVNSGTLVEVAFPGTQLAAE